MLRRQCDASRLAPADMPDQVDEYGDRIEIRATR
jgi:hypothetical protein